MDHCQAPVRRPSPFPLLCRLHTLHGSFRVQRTNLRESVLARNLDHQNRRSVAVASSLDFCFCRPFPNRPCRIPQAPLRGSEALLSLLLGLRTLGYLHSL